MSDEPVKWYYRPWVVVLLILFVLGAFGIPLVVKSPAISKNWKIILIILSIIYTLYLIVVTVQTTVTVTDQLLSFTRVVE